MLSGAFCCAMVAAALILVDALGIHAPIGPMRDFVIPSAVFLAGLAMVPIAGALKAPLRGKVDPHERKFFRAS